MIQSLSIIAKKCMSLFSREKTKAVPVHIPTHKELYSAEISRKTKEALARRKAAGLKMGRPAKTTAEQRNQIRATFAAGAANRSSLAREFNVSRSTIQKIIDSPMEVVEVKREERPAPAKPNASDSVVAVAVEPSLQAAEAAAPEVEVAFLPCSSYLGTLPKGSVTFSATHLSREAKSICDKRGLRRRWVAYSHDSVMGAYSYPTDILEEAYLSLLAEKLLKQGKSDAEVMAQLKLASR